MNSHFPSPEIGVAARADSASVKVFFVGHANVKA